MEKFATVTAIKIMVSVITFSSFNSFRLLHILLPCLFIFIFCAPFTSSTGDAGIRPLAIMNGLLRAKQRGLSGIELKAKNNEDKPKRLKVVSRLGVGAVVPPCGYDQYFDQILDHTNGNGTNGGATFKQKFNENMKFFDQSSRSSNNRQQSPVVLLKVGDEGNIGTGWVCNERNNIAIIAKEHNAILVQLEHRFFSRNASAGLPDMTPENLAQLFTVDQALADIASFIAYYNRLRGLTNARWVLFGSSYGASLAAWFRAKYPQLTVGAVASSALLWPKVDNWEYAARMEESINTTSPACHQRVRAAFAQMVEMVRTDKGKAVLGKLYNANPEFSELNAYDLSMFMADVFGTWQTIIQQTYSYPFEFNSINLTVACKIMTEGEDLQQSLYNVFWTQKNLTCADSGISEADCLENNYFYDNYTNPNTNVSIEGDSAEARGWLWLMCSQFGWFQTTDKENSIFGDIASMNQNYWKCVDAFGPEYGAKFVDSQVAKFAANFGDRCTFEATNVVMPQGRLDPWSKLALDEDCRDKAKDARNHLTTVWTEGASHCADTYTPYAGEPAGLNATRQIVRDEVRYYLETAMVAA